MPDNQTQIDRLKFSTKIGCNTDVYLLGYAGYNEDVLRDTYRNFNGADLRITNKSIDTLTLTASTASTTARTFALSPLTPLNHAEPARRTTSTRSRAWVNRPARSTAKYTAFGINGRWRPFEDQCGTLASRLSFVGGYEYSTLMRENAGDTLLVRRPRPRSSIRAASSRSPIRTRIRSPCGVEEKWSACSTRSSATSSSRPTTRCTALRPTRGNSAPI